MTTRLTRSLLAVVSMGAILGAGLPVARAALMRGPLEGFVAGIPVVVLAEVTEVSGRSGGDWEATAQVIEVWKGPKREIVTYRPGGFGTIACCTVSADTVGEERVLFLYTAPDRQGTTLYSPCGGTGSMRVFLVDKERLVDVRGLNLPNGAPVAKNMVPGQDRLAVPIEQLVPMGWLRDVVGSGRQPGPHVAE